MSQPNLDKFFSSKRKEKKTDAISKENKELEKENIIKETTITHSSDKGDIERENKKRDNMFIFSLEKEKKTNKERKEEKEVQTDFIQPYSPIPTILFTDPDEENEEEINGDYKELDTLEEKGRDYIVLAPKNLPPSYLLDVRYDGKLAKAYLKLYNPQEDKIYRFYDTSNHLPYLLTTRSKSEVERKLKNNKDYIGCETVTKKDLLREKEATLTKVIANNPLAIGGKDNSFRSELSPAYEANIRYHHNYIYDNGLVPGLLYEIKDGQLFLVKPDISPDIVQAISKIFSGQPEEVLTLLQQYLPTFFLPIPKVTRCAVDIEVHSRANQFPDVSKADEKVISVGFSDTNGNTFVYVLNEEAKEVHTGKLSYKVVQFKNEKELLLAVFEEISKYPIVVTFNGDNFDFLYLNQRAKNLNIPHTKIPFIITQGITKDVYLTYGLHIDLYRFFRQPAMRIYAFGGKYDNVSLDELGESLLGKKKLKLEKDIWDLDLEELVEYNARDAELTVELTTFNNNLPMEIIFMLSRITKVPVDDFVRTSVSMWIQNWMYFEHRVRNLLIPRKEDILYAKGDVSTEAMIKGKKYQGATVIQPKKGVWWNVYVLDFASLYPSIIKTKNLSYETLNCKHTECKINRIPETNHWVCNKIVGISSLLVGFIRDVRVYWFKDRVKDPSLSNEEKDLSNVIQSALKVLINACYGVFGSENFALYCPPLAESTTALARDAILKTKQYSENVLNIPVIYGDTDSIFLYNPTQEAIEELKEWSMNKFHIELGVDYVFRYCGLTSRKKNYFGITTRSAPVIKGLMGKKKNTPLLFKRRFEEVITVLQKVENIEDLEIAKSKIIKMTRELNQAIAKREFELEDLAIKITLSKKLKEYDSWTQPLQAALQLILAYPHRENPSVGSVITYIKTKPFKINAPIEHISDKISRSDEVSVKPLELASKEDIDIPKVKELVKSTFIQLLEAIEITWNEVTGQKSLDKWF